MNDTMVTDAEKTIEREPELVRATSPRQKPILVVVNAKPTPGFHRQLFAASMLELTTVDRAQRKWATLISVTLQSLILGILIMIPLMFPEVLPVRQLVTFLAAPPPPPPLPPPAPAVVQTRVVSQIIDGQLKMPSRIPARIQMIKEDATPISGGIEGGVVGGVPGGQLGGVLGGLVSTPVRATTLPAAPPPVVPQRVKISQGVSEGMLLNKVDPRYPVLALRARVQGAVQLRAIISREGTIENLVVINGHPLLVPAALEAVKSWRYRPYLLSGEPVEVETSIIVNFHFE